MPGLVGLILPPPGLGVGLTHPPNSSLGQDPGCLFLVGLLLVILASGVRLTPTPNTILGQDPGCLVLLV